MASICTFSPQFLLRKPDTCKFFIQRYSGKGVVVENIRRLRRYNKIRSCYKTKVFEDRAEGIICYKDENGQIICEGYDEGPRFHQQINTGITYHPRDVEIMQMLHRQWLQMTTAGEEEEDDEANNKNADKTVVALQDDFNWKWL
ncbi:hypothetical protein ACFE04_021731 [Oxalis oulophora]